MSRLLATLLCGLGLALSACAGDARQALNDLGRERPASPAPGLPSLADLPGPAKYSPQRGIQTSGTYSFGQADIVVEGGATMAGPLLTLNGSAPYSYAVFAYPLAGGSVGQLHVGGNGNQLYIAAADYSAGVWQWLDGPLGTPGSYDLPAACSSPAGVVYIALVCASGGNAHCTVSLDYENNEPTWDGTWNLLVWIAGDNNLAYEGYADIQEMEAVGSSADIRILCGYDIDPAYLEASQTGAEQVRFIKVAADSDPNSINISADPANQSFSRAGYNSADPANVAAFVDWAAASFPADHTVLCLWNHGDGWHRNTSATLDSRAGKDGRPRYPLGRLRKQGLLTGRQTSGILGDDADGESWFLTANDAVVSALGAHRFDLLMFDACNMANLESLYDFSPLADWLAGSECLVPGEGYDYAGALSAWNAAFPQPPQEVGRFFADAQITYFLQLDVDVAMGVFESQAVQALVNALKDFAAGVTAAAATEKDAVVGAVEAAYEPYGGDGQRDLKTFLETYAAATGSAPLTLAAQNALTALNGAVFHFTQNLFPDANGISVWLPSADYYMWFLEEYQSTPFDLYSAWSAMLEATGAASGPVIQTADWQPGDWIELTWADAAYDIDLYLTDPTGYNSGPYYESATENLFFSDESTWSGVPQEWAELRGGADGGPYVVEASRWDEQPGRVEVAIRLFDSNDALKQDFGSIDLDLYEFVPVAILTTDGTLIVAEWSAGDRLEISWGDPFIDVDLGVRDPQGYYSAPYLDFQTTNLFFSEDSYSSGVAQEFARLKAKAVGGAYFIALERFAAGAGIPISVKLFDEADALKQDFGGFMVPGDSYDTYIRLNFNPPE